MPSLAPTKTEKLLRARVDLNAGLPVVLMESGRAFLMAAIETLGQERFSFFQSPESLIILSDWRAKALHLPVYDKTLTRIEWDAGLSFDSIKALANPSDDYKMPFKGPFAFRRDQDAAIASSALELLKTAHLLPAAMIMPLEDIPAEITVLDPPWTQAHHLTRLSHAKVPLDGAEATVLHVFRDAFTAEEHCAVIVGDLDPQKAVLTRLHSACFTGDILGSLKCDCGPQLNAALAKMTQVGGGILLYLNQEGRGIGLANKMRAYALQDLGLDTVEANRSLGFEDDERDLSLGARILDHFDIRKIVLMTNNPLKVASFERYGISVERREPLQVGHTAQNRRYLVTKARKSGHLLDE